MSNADRLISVRYEAESERINGLHTFEGLKIFFLLIAVTVALGIDVIFDRANVLPDLFSAVLLIVSLLFLRRRFNGVFVGPCAITAGVYAAVSTVTTVLTGVFYSRYKIDDLADGVPGAVKLYRWVTVSGGIEAMLAIAVSILLFIILTRLFPLSIATRGNGLPRHTKEVEGSFKAENAFFLAVSMLGAIATFVGIILERITRSVEVLRDPESGLTTPVLVSNVDWFWMVPLVLSLVRLIIILHMTGRLRDEAREKYIGF